MEYLYDIHPIYMTEEQYDIRNPEIKDMSISDLLKEIDRTSKEIVSWQKEIDSKQENDRYPIYAVKERLTNAKEYKDYLHRYLSDNFPAEEVKKEMDKYKEEQEKKNNKDSDEYTSDD
jgi:hypothetical protein